MSSKYPKQLDIFQTKRNAEFESDPNGDFVMAEDINELQDAIGAIEETLGVNPQGNKMSVSDRITLLEGSSVLRVPPFLLYLGNPAEINGATSIGEAVSEYLKYDHVVFGNNAESWEDTDHETTALIIEEIQANRNTEIYGYIDCGVLTAGLEISEIQNRIQAWEDMGVAGIYCGNFGFEHGVDRERQNLVLDSIHQHGIIAIVNGNDPAEVLSNAFNDLNQGQLLPNIGKGDIYHYEGFVIDTTTGEEYENFGLMLTKLEKLQGFRRELGIRILATPVITSDVAPVEADTYFEYAHAVALLASVDMFYPVIESYGETTNLNRTYSVPSVVGDWYVTDAEIVTEGSIHSRQTTFGKIAIDSASKSYNYDGLYIPYNMLRIAANSIEGSLLKDATVEDKKIKSYDGQRLITSINSDPSVEKINIGKIAAFEYGDIEGAIPVDHLKANVVEAINAYIGTAKIGEAFIGDLSAEKIKSGTIDAERITASVVDAINLYAQNMTAESATIGEAVIGSLSAEKITAGTIDAERIRASVVDAINLSARQADIENLNADNITAGDIKAERIQTNVIQSINAYTDSLVANKAVIKAAAIGTLTAGHIQAEVINAINLYAGTATIDSAVIGELGVDHMKGKVIDAIKLYAGTAKIEDAQIGSLSASKLSAGHVDADLMKANVITAINAYIETMTATSAKIGNAVIDELTADHIKASVIQAINASIGNLVAGNAYIDQAAIGDLDADKIKAGDIDAERLKATVVEAINLYTAEMVAESATIDSGSIGVLQAQHMEAKVISAINASLEVVNATSAVIDSAKIGALTAEHIEAVVIAALEANIGTATIDSALIGDLSATKIKTDSLSAEVMTANAIAAVNADLTTATIEGAKIGQLTAEHIEAEVVKAINASIETAVIEAAKIGTLTAEHIKTTVIEAINANITGIAKIDGAVIGELKAENIQTEIIKAINASIETAVIDSAQVGVLSAEHIKSSVVEAINLKATTAKIEAARIGNLTAGHITTGSLSADVMRTNVIFAVNGHLNSATIDAAKIGKLTTQNLDAGIITSEHITTVGLDAEVIKTGQFHGDRIVGNSIDALKIVSGSITGREIAANTLTAREIQAGSITSEEIQVGSINAEHISTVGLDAQSVTVYNSKTGETLIGGGYLRVDGLDAGVVQSDNLAANGMFMTASSVYGNKRTNPAGEVIIGTESQVPGGNQIWKYDLDTGQVVTQIDIPGKKPAFIAIDGQQQYAYITVQGNDTLVQLDLAYDTLTENFRPMGKSPTKVKFTGDLLGDMKHLFVVNTDKTDLNAPDSFYVMDVPPHSDFSQLYIHHQIVTGNTPYDFILSEKDKRVYITLADQGDIMILEASNMEHTYKWKMIGSIPISPYGTDNYHGGLTAGYGIGTAVGGDSSSDYNKDHGAGHGGMSHGGHGGYSVSDGTMKEYKPHGIMIDTNENLLVVTEVEQNELVVINRIEQSNFEWPNHKSYTENLEWVTNVKDAIQKYDENPELAIADGYTFLSPWIPYMGYHFANTDPAAFNNDVPNTLMFLFDTTVNKYKLTGAEWMVSDPTIPSPVPGQDWHLAQPSMAHYADGLMIIGLQEADVPATHPETGSAFVSYSPFIYGIHFFSTIENPLGLFESFNPKLEWHNSRQPQFPPGFESYVDPNMPNSNYSEYQSPEGGVGSGTGGHIHSVEAAEPVFNIQAGEHESMPGMDHGSSLGPDTTGQGLVWKYVRHRIPIGDDPESIIRAHDKIWVTLMGTNKVAVMDETDLYRTNEDFAQGAVWTDYIRYIEVGSKPMDLIPDHGRMKMYVTVQGENKIAVIDMMTEQVETHWAAGANVTSGDITPDGKYMYVTNNGGVGELSFVYPEGAYIGDAFIGLEGDVQYQGAQFWTPDRSDWMFNPDGTLRSSATVEFRINEPFLNEGGYVKLSTQGLDQQYASIEQDIFNVSNFSNGNNFGEATAEKLDGTADRLKWYPNNKWITGSVSNINIASMNEEGQRVELVPDPSTYIIHNSTGEEDPETGAIVYTAPHIEFLSGDTVPAGGWVEIDYMYRANVWFKNHNASTLLAIENSSSRNFNSFFEVDEFVPKFITMDNQQTKAFDYEPIVNPGVTNGHFKGVQYSTKTNRVALADDANFVLSAAPISGTTHSIHDGDFGSSNYLELPSGEQNVTIDLGGKYMIGKLNVWHFWHDQRTYHGTKTEVSEDGINWITVFDSAIEGEYMETELGHEIKFWGYPEKPKNYTDNFIECIPVRYIRDTINGNTVNTNNHWVEVQAFGDWELDESYTYPAGSVKEGQQIATNGKGVVTTDISQASATIDLHIDFTSWWYMTYLVGPEFGSFDVEMPTVMGGSHVLPLDNPYINKVAHRHIMSWPPGVHQAVVKQRSGKVAIDRFRFEDYQYYDRSAIRIPSSADTSFTRYKIVPEQARDYVGEGNQSTHGAYDTPRVNPDTQLPDDSVSIKYRFRVKSVLDAGGIDPERGIAYLTSAIFEQGKLSSHWRPSSSSDNTPGNRIESWDGTQPHKTGIQWFHLANGAVRGAKILPSAIMDYHISPYARIGEYKLDLNHPTHQHGHIMTYADGSQYFMDNKHVIDSIMGIGIKGTDGIEKPYSGVSSSVARADHEHDHFSGKLTIHGDFKAVNHDADGVVTQYHLINGVEVNSFKNAYDIHAAATDLHFSAAERLKLNGISEGAKKVEASTLNGKIRIDDVETSVYTHPATDGSFHVPATGTSSDGKFLQAGATAGSFTWESVGWSDITGKPVSFTPPVASSTILGGVKVGSGITLGADGTISWSHPTGAGQEHVPSGGAATNVLKWNASGVAAWGNVSWTEVTGKPLTFAPSAHTHTSGQITDLNTVLSNYATKEELASAGEVQLDSVNTFTNQNIFSYPTGPAVVIKPSTAPGADTVVFQIANTLGGNLLTVDAEGDMVIEANLTVKGVTTYNGTNEVVGDYSITGNMNIGGSTVLGDALTDQTTVKGDLVVEGGIIPKGKSVEIGRFTVFGTGGDLQFQSDSITYEDIISHYSTFQAGSTAPFDAPQVGVTRKYRLLIGYSTVGAASAAKLKISQYSGADVIIFDLPEVNGAATGIVKHYRTAEFTTTYTGHTTFKALSAGVGKDLIIKNIEVIAYDYFA